MKLPVLVVCFAFVRLTSTRSQPESGLGGNCKVGDVRNRLNEYPPTRCMCTNHPLIPGPTWICMLLGCTDDEGETFFKPGSVHNRCKCIPGSDRHIADSGSLYKWGLCETRSRHA